MRKLLLFCVILIFSCQSRNEKENKNITDKLIIYFEENLKGEDNTNHLDSVRILKFDTITHVQILFKKINVLYDKIDENQTTFDELLESAKSDAQMMRLTAGLSNALYQNSKEDFKAKNEKMKDLQSEDSVLMQRADSLKTITHTADSTKLLYLQVKCLVQIKRKDLSVKRDTAFAFLNSDKNIVRYEDTFK